MSSAEQSGVVRSTSGIKLLFNPKFIFGLIVSIGLVVYLARETKWDEVVSQLQTLHWWILFPATLLTIFQQYVRALRWRYLLPVPAGRSPSITELFDALSIGNLASNVLPLRAGEFVRPYVLVEKKLYAFGTALVSVIVERIFDLSVVLITFAFAFPTSQGQSLLLAVRSFSVVACALVGGVVLAAYFPWLILSSAKTILKFFPPKLNTVCFKLTQDLLAGAANLKCWPRLSLVIVFTAVVWILTYLQFYLFLALFDVDLSLRVAVITAVCTALAVALPSAPGFIGVFQIGCVLGLHQISGYPQSMAVTYSIIMHALNFLIFIFCGLLGVARTGVSLWPAQGSKAEVLT